MNRHFEDARYYLGRAGTHAKAGVREELGPAGRRLRALVGREGDPESRLDRLRTELQSVERRAEDGGKRAVRRARRRLRT